MPRGTLPVLLLVIALAPGCTATGGGSGPEAGTPPPDSARDEGPVEGTADAGDASLLLPDLPGRAGDVAFPGDAEPGETSANDVGLSPADAADTGELAPNGAAPDGETVDTRHPSGYRLGSLLRRMPPAAGRHGVRAGGSRGARLPLGRGLRCHGGPALGGPRLHR